MVIPVVIGSLETVSEGLEKSLAELKIRGRIESIQTSELSRSVSIQRRVLET